MSNSWEWAIAAGALLALSLPAAATADEADARLEKLEQRIEELEKPEPRQSMSSLAEWAEHVALGGSARTGWYGGEDDSPLHRANFQVWDARLFVDAELGDDVRVAGTTVIRNVGFSFEWDLVRLGSLQNDVGELYTDFQGLGGSSWANVQVGRFQLPLGESYLGYSRGYSDNPFLSNPVGGPWFWDEGVKLYGASSGDRLGYVASITDGDNAFNVDANGDHQYTLKLYGKPTSFLHLSVSGAYSGAVGKNSNPAQNSIWLGEAWARAFGSGSPVTNYSHGAVVADAPGRIREIFLVGADAVATWPDKARVWFAYGTQAIEQKDGSYDRRLHYWIGEVLLYGGLVTPELSDVYVGFRAHGLGTYDSDEGYLLDFRYRNTLGYNMKSINAWSTVLGWKMLRYVTVRAEYTRQEIEIVRGASRAIRKASDDVDSWGVEVGIQF